MIDREDAEHFLQETSEMYLPDTYDDIIDVELEGVAPASLSELKTILEHNIDENFQRLRRNLLSKV